MKKGNLLPSGLTRFVLAIILFMFVLPVSAQNEKRIVRLDSLLMSMRHAAPHEQIRILNELIALHWQTPEEVPLQLQRLKVANRLDSIRIMYDSMASLSRYYYNEIENDSLRLWAKRLEELAQSRHESPDELFRAGSYVCMAYLWSGDYELAMNEAIRQLDLSEKTSQKYGMMRVHEFFGVFYQVINHDSVAVASFRKGLALLQKNKEDLPYEMQYISYMVISVLHMNYYDEAEVLLDRYNYLLNALESECNEKGSLYPIQRNRCLLNSFWADLYIRKGELVKAKHYLDRASTFLDESLDDYMKHTLYHTQAIYYDNIGNQQLCLEAIDRSLRMQRTPEMLKMKVDVLRALGEYGEAEIVYEELLTENETSAIKAFDRQIHQLRLLNDLSDNEQNLRELELQTQQIAVKQSLIWGFMSVSLFLVVLLYVLCFYYRKVSGLKNKLLDEKTSLEKSEKLLRVMTEAAELADQKKTAFIANISHEVRTPLNAIVGFSDLLLDKSLSEEKNTFAAVIKQNSELLMNLVNDVLDLSRIESEYFRLNIEPHDLVECCRNAIAGMEHKVRKGVMLTFISSVSSYQVNTDAFQLQQLLLKLLSNAAKFTTKGEITLSFEVKEVEGEAVFAVSDTGCGIPPDMQNDIFERFEKVNTFVQGTGLGLPICQMIARLFGGSICLDTSYMKGARFVFTYPLT
ncbi:MAG: HAMP domain-containing sensor histidine kinase [Tannerellaceae bacterium]